MIDRQTYRERVADEFQNWFLQNRAPLSENEIEHIISVGVSVLETRDGGIRGGSFVSAIIDNNLSAAIYKADITNRKVIPFYVHLKETVKI